ncbi:MAG: hypothetical protein C0502_05020 [Opitutus sp.]|nr:hypothetical protein [Opitutus sp.]
MKLDRFRSRRTKLARRRLCVRCGESAPTRGRRCCETCLAIEAEKNRQRRENRRLTQIEARRLTALRRKRAVIAAALARVDCKLDRTAAA